ncbi:hypothetical protein GGG16DRAFT_115070 [Schizophyllum commune]
MPHAFGAAGEIEGDELFPDDDALPPPPSLLTGSTGTAHHTSSAFVYPSAVLASMKSLDDPLGATALAHHRHADDIIKASIQNVTERNFGTVARGLIPDGVLPGGLSPSSILQTMSSGPNALYHRRLKRWPSAPNLDEEDKERDLAAFLNALSQCICDICGVPDRRGRTWTAQYHAITVEGGMLHRQPDVALIDASECKGIKANAEHKTSLKQMHVAVNQLHDHALNCFESQDNRLFHIGLVIASHNFRIVVHHRSGCITSKTASIHLDAVSFVRVIAGLVTLDGKYIGLDPSIRECGGKRYVTIEAIEYEIIKTLATSTTLVGQGAVTWLCKKAGEEADYIVQSVWHESKRARHEADFLRVAAERSIDGVPEFVAYEVVHDEGEPISTGRIATKLCGQDSAITEDRWLTRTVTKRRGLPLDQFSSKKELLSVIRDCIQTHRALLTRANIIHGNICDRTMLIRDATDGALLSECIRSGLLTDMTRSFFHCEGPDACAMDDGKVAPAFVACALLCDADLVRHYYNHDLESCLHVLIFTAATCSGPNGCRRQNFDILGTQLKGWLKGSSYDIGLHKSDILKLNADANLDAIKFDRFLDRVIDPYFDDLKDCIRELRLVVMRGVPLPTYREVLAVLDRHIERVKWPEPPENPGQANAQVATSTCTVPQQQPVDADQATATRQPRPSRRASTRKRKKLRTRSPVVAESPLCQWCRTRFSQDCVTCVCAMGTECYFETQNRFHFFCAQEMTIRTKAPGQPEET